MSTMSITDEQAQAAMVISKTAADRATILNDAARVIVQLMDEKTAAGEFTQPDGTFAVPDFFIDVPAELIAVSEQLMTFAETVAKHVISHT